MATNNDIAFAPNVTPGTFNELYTPTDSGCDATLSPLLEGLAARRSGYSRKKPINHIPRPPNAFILFRSSFIKSRHVSSEVETNHSTLSKIIGLTWKNLPSEERQIWHDRAKVALDEHKRKFPSYAFKPIHNKPRGMSREKRKMREVGLKDHTRCAKIAELLVRGKKGLELEVAIQEFDKNYVPKIVTRFEAPITANNYALSSMSNADKRRLSYPSRHSQAPVSPPSINLAQERLGDSPDTSPFEQHSLTPLALSPSFVSLFFISAPARN
jgi:HMG (high mobility group) box